MRAFVAVDVDSAGASPRARAPSHITLRFLGEIGPDRLAALDPPLREVARKFPPFRIRLDGVGAFPDRHRPRVLWIGVTDGRAALVDLAERVRRALEPVVGVDPTPFAPHLTLFRVRSPPDRTAAEELLGGQRPMPAPRDVEVRQLLLKESELGRGGAVHRVVGTFPLAGRETELSEGPSAA